ncbi:RNA-directed DNA polymerase reverse transcriptase [Abeliophyllum distichum]|uniref:RNA-directed DNA polymerase reverse transcriptase n=1 Tax=Abeliophyllum distichum TaxID=126358 RepID=A0ABD1TX18_9LAMI
MNLRLSILLSQIISAQLLRVDSFQVGMATGRVGAALSAPVPAPSGIFPPHSPFKSGRVGVGVGVGSFGFFSSSREFRQGDPISPSLCIITADYFSRLLTQQYEDIPLMAYRHMSDALISYLSFADDMIIFVNGQKQSIRRILQCIDHYEGTSRQLVNRDKSEIILPMRFSTSQIRRLDDLTEFCHQQHPFTYLCVPLFKRARKIFFYDDLVQKVRSRIFGWTSRLLSFEGRITLMQSMLSSIPLYLFQIMKPSKTILKKLEGIFARFLWNSKDHAHRLHWKRWKDLVFLLRRVDWVLGDWKILLIHSP